MAVSDPRPMERGAIRSARQSSSRCGWAIPQLEKMLRARAHADDLMAIFAFRHFILRKVRRATNFWCKAEGRVLIIIARWPRARELDVHIPHAALQPNISKPSCWQASASKEGRAEVYDVTTFSLTCRYSAQRQPV